MCKIKSWKRSFTEKKMLWLLVVRLILENIIRGKTCIFFTSKGIRDTLCRNKLNKWCHPTSSLPNKAVLFWYSPWSKTAPSPAGWPFFWQCWACWGTSLTRWTWPTRWTGCGGNTLTHRSLQWLPCPGWWSEWPLRFFWPVAKRSRRIGPR